MANDNQADEERRSRIGLIVGGIAVVALLVFIFQNTGDTNVQFLWMDGDVPTFLLLIITVVLTLVIAVVAAWLLNRRSRR